MSAYAPWIIQYARKLRLLGHSYEEICKKLNRSVPKSTLSYWVRDLSLTSAAKEIIAERTKAAANNARLKAVEKANTRKKVRQLELMYKNEHLKKYLLFPNVQKILLAILYAAEGAKNLRRGSLTFGNSDPKLIMLFLALLRNSYPIDESKFRCTVQCRADQEIEDLESYWSECTSIDRKQFYKARVDQRSIGKYTKIGTYKGVCRIDYLSTSVLIDLLAKIAILTNDIEGL